MRAVLSVDSKGLICAHLPILFLSRTRVDFNKVIYFAFEGFGNHNRSNLYVFYYYDEFNKIKVGSLFYFRFFSNKKLVELLNFLNSRIKIDTKSFECLGIEYKNGHFSDEPYQTYSVVKKILVSLFRVPRGRF
ncbi:MAG: hypothetical protein H6584_06190 [Flavobacteriales bacterium]|nr:hypothetical protein [Flavobacteriales bacterium]